MSDEILPDRNIQNTPKGVWDSMKDYQRTTTGIIKCNAASGKEAGCNYPARWECSDNKNYCGYCRKIEENKNSDLIWERLE